MQSRKDSEAESTYAGEPDGEPIPQWQLYELLAEKIMDDFATAGTASGYDLAPHNAVVKWNDSILGHDSETGRQIDVSIRWAAFDREFLTVVQAKNYAKPADVNIVGEFSAVIRDIRATAGILVCNRGFTRSARTYAQNLGIRLLGLHDAQSADWRYEVRVPFLWVDNSVQAIVRAPIWADAGDSMVHEWLYRPRVKIDGEHHVVDVRKAFIRRWNAGELQRTPGMTHLLSFGSDCEIQTEAADGTPIWRPVPYLVMAYQVIQQVWLAHLQLDSARGVVDHLASGAFIVSELGQPLPVARDDSWQPITDPAQVAATTMGTLITSESLELAEEFTSGPFEVTYLGPDLPTLLPDPAATADTER